MPKDQYTHTFKFQLGDNTFLDGECEFNSDGKASFKMNKLSEPIPLETITEFTDLMIMIKKLYEDNSGVRKITIKEKE